MAWRHTLDKGVDLVGAVRIYKDPRPQNPRFPWQARADGCVSKTWRSCHGYHADSNYCNAYKNFEEVLESLQTGALGEYLNK